MNKQKIVIPSGIGLAAVLRVGQRSWLVKLLVRVILLGHRRKTRDQQLMGWWPWLKSKHVTASWLKMLLQWGVYGT